MKPVDSRLMKFAPTARRYVALLGGVGFLETALVLAQCFFIAASVAPVADGDLTFRDIGWPVFGVAAAFTARSVLIYIRESYGHRAALRTIANLRARVLRRAGDLGDRWLASGNTSTTVTLVTSGLDDLEPYFVKFLPQLILTCTVTPFALVVILFLDWVSAIAIVACIPLIPIFMILIGRMTQAFSNERLASMQRLGQQLLDLLGGLSTLKALGREEGPARRVKHLGDDYAKKTLQTLYIAFLSGAVLEFLATLSTALVAVEVGLRMVAGNVSLFTGLTIIMLTPEVFKPLREVGTQFHASSNGVAASAQVFDLLEQPLPVEDGTVECPDLANTPITIRDLSVLAPGRDTIAPAQLNADILPGHVTALRGASGSGKTTTANVLLRFIAPDSGTVHIGTTPLESIRQESLWQQVSWVSQRPVIVPGTVAENIGVTPGPALERAAALAGFDEVIAELPEGWNTFIGQGGVGLSVGQRQRLALTRALVSERPLVLLDEPSAHLDARSERRVVESVAHLRAQGRTVIVIAHRTALLDLADAVIDVVSTTAQPAATSPGTARPVPEPAAAQMQATAPPFPTVPANSQTTEVTK